MAMDEGKRCVPNSYNQLSAELSQIIREAQHRWLRPPEICQLLTNYNHFELEKSPPLLPQSGSLFLFDRKALRYFRKDGHRWRKKKDGKTVREAHEKLKAGSVDVLHCYYAHGEDNQNFQRRCYWMLDGNLEHIVLVHYREIKEGYKSGVSRLLVSSGAQVGTSQTSSDLLYTRGNSPSSTIQTSHASGQNPTDDVDSGYDPKGSAGTQPFFDPASLTASCQAQAAGLHELSRDTFTLLFPAFKFVDGNGSTFSPQVHSSSCNASFDVHGQKFFVELPSGTELTSHKLTDAGLNAGSADPVEANVKCTTTSSNGLFQVPQDHDFSSVLLRNQNHSCSLAVDASTMKVENKVKDGAIIDNELGQLKKLDSFGRWMDKEIGGDCDDSLMASDSGNYWNSLDTETDEKEVSSLSHHMQLDMDSLGPSLSREQLFSILDFSPDWAFSGDETKVLIVGTFLGNKKISGSIKWGCMFGEIEVSAEVLTDNVIRCQAPSHAPGHVPFYVTCSNRVSCSEVRDFQFLEKPPGVSSPVSVRSVPGANVCLQTRLAKLLSMGIEKKWLSCSANDCDGCKVKNTIYSVSSDCVKDWSPDKETPTGDCRNPEDKLIQNLLKEKLHEWLVSKAHEGGKCPQILDDEGLAIIHLTAALGYAWAMAPIIASGVNINFRDTQGRTALHWASYFGREETVIALVKLGAYLGAVDDPTPAVPDGHTAADLASSRGHKGIAGYLAEAYLSNHLSSLTINKNAKFNVAATIAEKMAADTGQDIALIDDSSKGPIAAVQKSACVAALIQDAFRTYSFRQRQLNESSNEMSEVSVDLVALGSLTKVKRRGHFEDYLHCAAIKIQQKYRGWKDRKEFLKIRKRIVKIQAHVRGHQVRKQYKRVVWSVSIVEKAILRWRRKGTGLRGFRAHKAIGNVLLGESEKTDEYEFLRIGRKQKFAGVEKALERVKSMARNPEACDQYMRLVTRFEKMKMSAESMLLEESELSNDGTKVHIDTPAAD